MPEKAPSAIGAGVQWVTGEVIPGLKKTIQ